jgi:hypothetical protein
MLLSNKFSPSSTFNPNQLSSSEAEKHVMSQSENKKLILVIGATGAQGRHVVDALLAPDASGKASPYAVRALTRDPASAHAVELAARGVECVKGLSVLPHARLTLPTDLRVPRFV